MFYSFFTYTNLHFCNSKIEKLFFLCVKRFSTQRLFVLQTNYISLDISLLIVNYSIIRTWKNAPIYSLLYCQHLEIKAFRERLNVKNKLKNFFWRYDFSFWCTIAYISSHIPEHEPPRFA